MFFLKLCIYACLDVQYRNTDLFASFDTYLEFF